MTSNTLANHIKSLRHSLNKMVELGYNPADCLKGTGITLSDIEEGSKPITLLQEFRFHKNLIAQVEDPLLGLKLGEAYPPEVYGVMGYAIISASDFRHALTVTSSYGDLTFTMFTLKFEEGPQTSQFIFQPKIPLKGDMLKLFSDRDTSAAKVAFEITLNHALPLQKVYLPHNSQDQQALYENYFGCPVEFNTKVCRIEFDSSVLDELLPKRDNETSAFCEQQCQHLIKKLSKGSGFIDDVRMALMANPGYFPDLQELASRLAVSDRTLRRKLKQEGSSYQELLDEIRFGLAKEYLSETLISMEEISDLLGYTEPGNFSHAFKRWSGTSPLNWRKDNAPTGTS